jgi:hypothetical protein
MWLTHHLTTSATKHELLGSGLRKLDNGSSTSARTCQRRIEGKRAPDDGCSTCAGSSGVEVKPTPRRFTGSTMTLILSKSMRTLSAAAKVCPCAPASIAEVDDEEQQSPGHFGNSLICRRRGVVASNRNSVKRQRQSRKSTTRHQLNLLDDLRVLGGQAQT